MRALLLTLVAAGPLAAQVVTGSVVLRDSTPAQGVIVVANTERGSAAARALTGPRGDFVLRLAAPGTYTLTMLRIGFRPTRGSTVTVGVRDTAHVRFVFTADAVTLTTMNVRERQTCRVSADTGLAVARVWEEARKAMLSSQLTGANAPVFAEWIEYDRMLDPSGRTVREQRVRTSRYPTTHAFTSLSAEVLDSAGYVVEDNTGTVFYAPDVAVLLSDVFVADHCFQLAPAPPGQTNLIGVAIEPTRERRDAHDITGTLWVDRSTAELRSLEFKYTNLPDIAAAVAGGRVEFLRLTDGNWLVNRWAVRMPRLGVPQAGTTMTTRRGAFTASARPTVRDVQVTGGEVRRVARRDTTVYEAGSAAVTVQLSSRDTAMRIAGASLALDGTDYAATANTQGRARLAPVLDGRYVAHVKTALMDSLGLAPVDRELDARPIADSRVDTLMLPNTQDLLLLACPRDSVRHGEGMLRGSVHTERAAPVPHAAVTVTWQTDAAIVGMADANHLRWNEQTIGSLSDDTGQWRVCGVPRGVLLSVRVTTDSGSDGRKAKLDEQQAFGAADLVVHRETGSLNREASAALGEMARPRALVEFIVRDLNGAALAQTTLEMQPPSGPSRTIVTGESGRALLPDVAPGLITVRARRIGFKEGRLAVSVDAGRNTVPVVLSQASLPVLDTVRVLGGRTSFARNDEFDTRRLNREATVSVTRADIVKRNPVDLWQMLTGVPSIRIVDDDGGVLARSTRSPRPLPNGELMPCYLAVMLNGMIMSPDPGKVAFDLRRLPPPDQVYGVELFAGAASIPVQYGGVGGAAAQGETSSGKWCGMIAVWTR